MGLVDLTKDLTYNSNFETEPVENQQQQVSSDFQTSNLESSPTEEIGSVNFFQNPHGADENGVGGFNIDGFTQFMTSPDTLYPGEGLNNSGIVDSFPSPHGIGQHNIEGFVADVQPLSDGFYPNTIELGSVDFFPGGPFTNNSNYASGFTENMQPFGGDKLGTQYNINTYYTDTELTFGGITQGTPSPGLSQYSAGLDSQYTSIAEGVNGDVDWNLQIGAAGLGDTEPPYSLGQLKTSLPSMNIETSGYLGSVDFFPGGKFSNNFTTSTGFTKNAEAFGEDKITTEFLMIDEDTISQTFLNNEMFRSIKIDGTYKGAVNFISNDDATGFTKNMYVDGESKLPSQYTMFTDGIIGGAPNPSVSTYPLATSIFVKDPAGFIVRPNINPDFRVFTDEENDWGTFQPGNVAGMIGGEGSVGDATRRGYAKLLGDGAANPGMMSWNVDGFTYDQFTSKVGTNSFGKTTNTDYLNYDSFLGIPTGPDGDDVGSNLIHFKNGAFGSGFNDSSTAFSYKNIPSLKSVPKPTYNAISGPFSADSGFSSGDFKLGLSSDGTMQTYLQSGLNEENTAVEGSIVTDVTLGLVRSGVSTLGTKLENGDTIFRDIKNMGGMAQTEYGTAYGDGINNGWMKGLIDTSIKDKRDYSGHSADFFIRESGGQRFLGRIAKDLQRITKWQFQGNGLLSLAKNGVMSFFNPSEKSFQLGVLAQYTAAAGGMFGLRPTSAFSSIVDLLTNAVFGKSEFFELYYETRVNKPHPKVSGGASGFLQRLNPLPPTDLEGGRTLFTRYGQPGYPKKGQFGIKKPKRAHELYARGFKDRENGSGFNAIDFINIRGYDDTSPDEYGDVKDLIKFYIRDIRNGKILRFRAFISGITDAISPQYNPYKFIGRPDEVYTYKGTTRAVSFTLKIAAMSRHEMYPMWEKLNYLVGLTYGSYADTNTDGQYAQTNPGMSAPITMMTLGDYFVDQPGYIKDLSITMGDSPWDTIIDDEGKNAVGELPQQVELNIGYQLIPQQIPDSYGKHFGKVGTPDVRGKDGLPWLPDMYMNDGISAVERFEGLGSGNPPETASDEPTGEGEDPSAEASENAKNKASDAANEAANDLPAGTPG